MVRATTHLTMVTTLLVRFFIFPANRDTPYSLVFPDQLAETSVKWAVSTLLNGGNALQAVAGLEQPKSGANI